VPSRGLVASWASISSQNGSVPVIPSEILQSALPSVFNILCSGLSSVFIPVGSGFERERSTFSCAINGSTVAREIYVMNEQVRCPVPSLRPGTYLLQVAREKSAQSVVSSFLDVPKIAEITCLPRPSVLSVIMEPLAADGAHQMTFAGVNIESSTDLFCSIDAGRAFATGILGLFSYCLFIIYMVVKINSYRITALCKILIILLFFILMGKGVSIFFPILLLLYFSSNGSICGIRKGGFN
jgi:hypothetical protein